MNGEANIRRKQKGVVLCRSRKHPEGKEIQGLVFDHPSMPKIVTVSSVPKKSSEEVRTGETYPTGEKRHTAETHLVKEISPTGRKYPTGNHHHERYPTGHFTPEKYDTGYFNQRTSTAQHYPTVQRTTGQFPLRRSPPALIHTPSRYPTEHQVMPPQSVKTNVSSAPFYGDGQPLPATVSTARNMQIPYPQHTANVPSRTQEVTVRRNSTSTFRPHPENGVPVRQNIVQQPKNGVQYHQNIVLGSQNLVQPRQNVAQHSENGIQLRQNIVPYSENGAKPRQYGPQHSMSSATDRFSRDFHLKIWRESHGRAVKECYPPARGQDQPATTRHQPLTSSHNLEAFRQRSLSTGAHERSSLVHRSSVENPPFREAHPQPMGRTLTSKPQSTIPAGKYVTNIPPARDMRRYSTGHLVLQYSEASTIETQTSPEDWTHSKYTSRTRNTEIRTSSTEEHNPVVQSSERTNAGHTKSSSQCIEELCSVVQKVEVPDSKESNAGGVKSSDMLAMRVADMIEQRKNKRGKKRRISPTVVVISDSDDEGLKIPSPLSADENADVFVGPSPDYGAADGNGFVRENLDSNSPRNSDGEGACVITGVKAPGKQPFRLGSDKFGRNSIDETGPSKFRKDSCDFNNNEKTSQEITASNFEQNRGGMESSREQNKRVMGTNREHRESGLSTNYRSVLYEREVSGRSGTQKAIMSEQLLFDKSRGLKRSLDDKSEYFVAGSAEIAGNPIHDAVRKIRRISSNVSESHADAATRSSDPRIDIFTSRQSLPERRGSVNSGEYRKPTRNYEDMPKLIRSRSENDDKISKPECKSERSRSLTYEAGPSSYGQKNTVNHMATNHDFLEKFESSCKACVDDEMALKTNMMSRDELRCHKCDRELTEKPGIDGSQSVVKLPKVGPKPTGIVVGVKQAPEAKQPLKQETSGSKSELKNVLKSQVIGLDHELKQLLKCGSAGSEKPTKDSGIKYIVIPEEDDVIHKTESPELGGDLDVLHFSVVKKDATPKKAESEVHVKSIVGSRDTKPVSLQWGTYSLKLEQGDVTKVSCGKSRSISVEVRRNSWEELKKKFSTEDGESCNESRKRKNSWKSSCQKSYRFHDLSEQYKRRRLSDDGEINSEFNTGQGFNNAICGEQNIVPKDDVQSMRSNTVEDEQITVVDVPNLPKTTTSASTNPPKDLSNLLLVRKDSNSRIVITTADSNPPVFSLSEENTHEMQSSAITPNPTRSSEEKTFEKDAHEKDPHEIRPSEKLPSRIGPLEIQPPDIARSTSPEKETQQKEELSLAEWTEILQGRIAQVKESIEEEKTPWKTKNKKKVLEKLENHYVWLTGPDVDEAFFVSRKLQFFQTMRKQYELMNKVKTQRQSMKSSDSTPQVGENTEKSKEKVVKQVEVSKEVRKVATKRVTKKTKEMKKTVKCRPKSVKNTGGNLMKKIRKAVLL